MKMTKVILDESLLDIDSWLTDEILKELTEELFNITIEDDNVPQINSREEYVL